MFILINMSCSEELVIYTSVANTVYIEEILVDIIFERKYFDKWSLSFITMLYCLKNFMFDSLAAQACLHIEWLINDVHLI